MAFLRALTSGRGGSRATAAALAPRMPALAQVVGRTCPSAAAAPLLPLRPHVPTARHLAANGDAFRTSDGGYGFANTFPPLVPDAPTPPPPPRHPYGRHRLGTGVAGLGFHDDSLPVGPHAYGDRFRTSNGGIGFRESLGPHAPAERHSYGLRLRTGGVSGLVFRDDHARSPLHPSGRRLRTGVALVFREDRPFGPHVYGRRLRTGVALVFRKDHPFGPRVYGRRFCTSAVPNGNDKDAAGRVGPGADKDGGDGRDVKVKPGADKDGGDGRDVKVKREEMEFLNASERMYRQNSDDSRLKLMGEIKRMFKRFLVFILLGVLLELVVVFVAGVALGIWFIMYKMKEGAQQLRPSEGEVPKADMAGCEQEEEEH